MRTIEVTNLLGYKISAQVNEKTSKLCNFTIKGAGANPNSIHTTFLDAEKMVKQLSLTSKNQEKKKDKI